MGQVHIEVTRVIDAPPEAVFSVLADYNTGHPAILPKQYFKELTVEEGGIGAGTVFRTRMSVLGMTRRYHMTVSEPEPGRVMIEKDSDAGVETAFTIDPVADGTQSRVSVTVDARTSPGLMGIVEKWLNPVVLQRIFGKELEQLDGYVRAR